MQLKMQPRGTAVTTIFPAEDGHTVTVDLQNRAIQLFQVRFDLVITILRQ